MFIAQCGKLTTVSQFITFNFDNFTMRETIAVSLDTFNIDIAIGRNVWGLDENFSNFSLFKPADELLKRFSSDKFRKMCYRIPNETQQKCWLNIIELKHYRHEVISKCFTLKML